MRISDYDFHLPDDRIARHPLPERDKSRMMIVDRSAGTFRHSHVGAFPDQLRSGDLLVLNDTKVFPARLYGVLSSGRRVEALFVRDLGEGEWLLLIRPSKKVRAEEAIVFESAGLDGIVLRRGGEGEWVVRFPPGSVDAALDRSGLIPLPPYIDRDPVEEDRERYQTVYADRRGSVAAPTAGLHFTDELLGRVAEAGVAIARVTLHVGPGTFRPIRVDRVEDHVMEEEFYDVPEESARLVNETRVSGGRVIAVGTTVVRTLESAVGEDQVVPGPGSTDLFLYPPHTPKIVDGMLTNFHLPQSTLFLLVSALAGLETMKSAYSAAIEEGYRFYSYGDCMLIL